MGLKLSKPKSKNKRRKYPIGSSSAVTWFGGDNEWGSVFNTL